jgi:hypothetical protein
MIQIIEEHPSLPPQPLPKPPPNIPFPLPQQQSNKIINNKELLFPPHPTPQFVAAKSLM